MPPKSAIQEAGATFICRRAPQTILAVPGHLLLRDRWPLSGGFGLGVVAATMEPSASAERC